MLYNNAKELYDNQWHLFGEVKGWIFEHNKYNTGFDVLQNGNTSVSFYNLYRSFANDQAFLTFANDVDNYSYVVEDFI